MNTATLPPTSASHAVNRLVPFIHVADVRASLDFYALLGFVPQSAMKDDRGDAYWALAKGGAAEIMLARASGPVDAEQQAVILYMYSADVAGLRQRLLSGGVRDRGVYRGVWQPGDGPRTVFAVAHPAYMPAGELRIVDPDGYIILAGQLG